MSAIQVGERDAAATSTSVRCAHCCQPFTAVRPVLEDELPRMCPSCGHFGSLRLVVDGVQLGGANR